MKRHTVHLARNAGEAEWKPAARVLDRALVPPEAIDWIDAGSGQGDLLSGGGSGLPDPLEPPRTVSRDLAEIFPRLLLHSDFGRFALAYRLLWRSREEPRLARIASDPDVARAQGMVRSVRRDMHKMTAFVRFRETARADGTPHFIAWFEPDHHIVEATAPFFSRRFANMAWSILTPDRCAHWDGAQLAFCPGVSKEEAPTEDRLEEVWSVYYASIFNPARLKVKAMTAEMPKKYWRNLPEAAAIPGLIQAAQTRTEAMIAAPAVVANERLLKGCAGHMARRAAEQAEDGMTDQSLRGIAQGVEACERCPLYRNATQGVPGEGPLDADLVLIGEQPGDQEDLAGRPFVGPAGKVLDQCMAEAGIERAGVFLTNAVKHFKHEQRGKRRLHKKPSTSEIDICRWWLEQELELVRPRLVVALGATAARGVLGRTVTISAVRGNPIEREGRPRVLVTVHPSYLLRIPDREAAEHERRCFIADLGQARALLG